MNKEFVNFIADVKINKMLWSQILFDEEVEVRKDLPHLMIRETKVALLVEIGELLNEYPIFKFWKDNKEFDRNKIKSEYSDVLHFTLSLVHKLGIRHIGTVKLNVRDYYVFEQNNILDLTLLLQSRIINLEPNKPASGTEILDILIMVMMLGKKFGFSDEDIVNIYYEKHQINNERLDNNY